MCSTFLLMDPKHIGRTQTQFRHSYNFRRYFTIIKDKTQGVPLSLALSRSLIPDWEWFSTNCCQITARQTRQGSAASPLVTPCPVCLGMIIIVLSERMSRNVQNQPRLKFHVCSPLLLVFLLGDLSCQILPSLINVETDVPFTFANKCPELHNGTQRHPVFIAHSSSEWA